jgi:DNA-binding NarL/FixJ family response regulator
MASSAKSFAVKTVLVVNADPLVEDVLSKVFEPGSWSMRHAPDNAAALALNRTSSFDLIITSEKTSASKDIELLRKIRTVRPHTRLIILTDESTPADVISSMRAHAFSYFSTPFSGEALGDMIRAALDEPVWDDGIEILAATPEWIRVRARCDFRTADRLLQFLDEIAELPENERHVFAMASREMLLNAIEHGGELDPANSIEIEYVRAKHMVMCHIADPGEGFALHQVPHAATANPSHDPTRHAGIREAQGMRPGGYGILLAKHLVDELIYSEEGNEVVLVKYLDFQCAQFV